MAEVETLEDMCRDWQGRTGLPMDVLARRARMAPRTLQDLRMGRVASPHRSSILGLARALKRKGADVEASIRASVAVGKG